MFASALCACLIVSSFDRRDAGSSGLDVRSVCIMESSMPLQALLCKIVQDESQ